MPHLNSDCHSCTQSDHENLPENQSAASDRRKPNQSVSKRERTSLDRKESSAFDRSQSKNQRQGA